MLYIGGGAGMAPMRSHFMSYLEHLKLEEKLLFSMVEDQELSFYIHYFRDLEKDFPNFKFHLVLSDALPEDNWVDKKDLDDTNGDGFTGFVHQVVIDKFLSNHEAPERS